MGDYYGVQGGAGGGDGEDTNVHTIWLEKDGPSSYDSTNGISINLASAFSSIGSFDVAVIKGTRGNVPFGRIEKSISGTSIVFKIKRERFERITGTGNVQNQPSGVTVQSSSGQTSTSENSHTHDATHNHAAANSSVSANGNDGVDNNALGVNIGGHTHTVDLPSMSVTSGAGSSHNHTDNTLYDHDHEMTNTVTNYSIADLANATNLSATLFSVRVTGQRA